MFVILKCVNIFCGLTIYLTINDKLIGLVLTVKGVTEG